MKTNILKLIGMFFLGTSMMFAQSKTEKIKVSGNCGMCKKRIEKAVNSVDGIISANWDKKTKFLVVSFDESKTSNDKIQKAVANAGYDTPDHKAKDSAYNALPDCCQYDRKK